MKRSRLGKNAGLTLAVTIMSIGLALILGLSLSSASITHLHMSGRGVTKVKAESAADACIAEIATRIVTDGGFGIAGRPEETLHIQFPESEAFITFNESEANRLGVPVSTSNRFGIDPLESKTGQTLPPHTVLLHCLARSGDTEMLFECYLKAPEFPYVIASSGDIESEGALVVGAAESAAQAKADDLTATAIASNGNIDIEGQARLYGDLTSSGQIELAETVLLQGEIREGAARVGLDDLSIGNLRPEGSVPLNSTLSPKLEGSVHHNGPSVTITGGLTLDDAVLYINGDAHIRGGVKGRGAIVVNGDLTLEGSSSLVARDQLAVVVQDDLTITGSAQDSSFFQGLVYTEGDFFTEDVTLMGAFVANRRANSVEPGSQIKLRNTTLVHVEKYSRFDLDANAYLVWGENGNKTHSGGRETLYLIEVDSRDAEVINKATTTTVNSFIGAEGEASDTNGGSGSEGYLDSSTSTNIAAIAAVARARKATVENGVLVSDWEEIPEVDPTNPDPTNELMQILTRVNPPTSSAGRSTLRYPPPSRPSPAPLAGFAAPPDNVYVSIARSSFHQDLNEFLGESSRLKIVSMRELRD